MKEKHGKIVKSFKSIHKIEEMTDDFFNNPNCEWAQDRGAAEAMVRDGESLSSALMTCFNDDIEITNDGFGSLTLHHRMGPRKDVDLIIIDIPSKEHPLTLFNTLYKFILNQRYELSGDAAILKKPFYNPIF